MGTLFGKLSKIIDTHGHGPSFVCNAALRLRWIVKTFRILKLGELSYENHWKLRIPKKSNANNNRNLQLCGGKLRDAKKRYNFF